jgi:DNA repair protein RecO (recombination protein O)
MENADALVLRTVDFSETSLILTLYTRQFGKIDALAKGGRRLKSPFESALDILARIRVTFLKKRGDTLDLLTEAKLIRRFRVSPSNLTGLFAGYYVVELVDALTENNDPNPTLYDLTAKLLTRLEQGTFLMRSLIRFEGLLLKYIGQQPSLRNCSECGTAVIGKNTGSVGENVREVGNDSPMTAELNLNPEPQRFVFGHLEGGVICPRCVGKLRQEGQKQYWSYVSADALRAIELLSDPNDKTENWKHFKLNKNVQNEIRGLHNHYFSHLLGRKPKMYDWLMFIAQNDKEQI